LLIATQYQSSNRQVWQGRTDNLPNERYFQRVQCIDLQQSAPPANAYTLLGFACDTGVIRNQGRAGAKQGPNALRSALANFACHHQHALYDVGEIVCESNDLEASQQSLAHTVALLLKNQNRPILIGGGHEIAWGHYLGIRQAYPTQSLAIINFDAHFDLRPFSATQPGSSGTPFLQMALHSQQHHLPFHYACIGIQPNANTASLFATAQQLGVMSILAQELTSAHLEQHKAQLSKLIEQVDIVYLTLCLDVFASYIAPGVSAPQVLGVHPQQILPLFEHITHSQKVVSFDIAELAPNYDDANQSTAKLAAYWVDQFCVI
jgi:formiminoglutamase